MPTRINLALAQLSRRALAATVMAGAFALAIPAQAEVKSLDIIAPAGPGGGWDQTARAMQTALQEGGLASGIQVKNIAGAGGTIGLAQFVTSEKKKGDAILVGGLVMVGAILTNKAPVTLDDVTPLARLTGEYELIVVPADGPIKTMADLVAKLKADPGSVSWGGGSTGGTDHILAGLIAKAAGVDPAGVNYIAHSGGGEALSSILGGHVTAGISGYEEFAPQIAAGKLRALAISSDERLPGIDIPTLKEQGLDVSLVNWRGVFAPPQIREKDMKALEDGDRQDGRGTGLEGHPDQARLARSLPARRRLRRLPQGGPDEGRDHAQGCRPRQVGAGHGRRPPSGRPPSAPARQPRVAGTTLMRSLSQRSSAAFPGGRCSQPPGLRLGGRAAPAHAQIKGLEILAPAGPGGGYDQLARAIQQVLEKHDLASGVQVQNIPGAGGTIGLAQFVTKNTRTPTVMVGRARPGRRHPDQQVAGHARPGDPARPADRRIPAAGRGGRLADQVAGRPARASSRPTRAR